jgi:hypothetical protein
MHRQAITRQSSHPAAGGSARWRLSLLLAVLVGFFLMHGVSSGDSCAGAASPLVVASQNAPMSVEGAATDTVTVTATGSATVTAADHCGCDGTGLVCVPLRPQSITALLTVLMIGFALAAAEATGLLALAGGGWGLGGPPTRRRAARAVSLRVLVCVSRT